MRYLVRHADHRCQVRSDDPANPEPAQNRTRSSIAETVPIVVKSCLPIVIGSEDQGSKNQLVETE